MSRKYKGLVQMLLFFSVQSSYCCSHLSLIVGDVRLSSITKHSWLMSRDTSVFQLDFRTPPGFDRTRNAEIGNKDIKFKHLEEAFTSEHWLVRIYKVKNLGNREPLDHKLRSVVPKQKYTSKKVRVSSGSYDSCYLSERTVNNVEEHPPPPPKV